MLQWETLLYLNAAKKSKKPNIQSDEHGHFVWETYFVRGKQKRRKERVTVIDGKIIDDLDEWLLDNANDIDLHQMERWDLIERRRLDQISLDTPDASDAKAADNFP